MSKLFFFDIDGTLIDCNKGLYGISTINRNSFDQLKQKGHDVFLATGRCKCFITEGVMDYPFSGYVTCNGGYVEYKGDAIYKAVVPAKAIEETIKLSKEHHFSFYFESSDYIYVLDKNDPQHKEFARVWGMKDETIIDDFDPQEIETYIGMIIINSKEDIPLLVETLSPYFDIQRHQTGCSFDLTLKDGIFYGRGVLDNKGPILANLYALAALKRMNFPLTKTIRIIFGTDEESG